MEEVGDEVGILDGGVGLAHTDFPAKTTHVVDSWELDN